MEWILNEIPGFNNYIAYSNGVIVSKITNKALKGEITKNGYVRVVLCSDNAKKRFLLHRLIASISIYNYENKPCINHKDGNKLNNAVSNLEWCTYSENIKHAFNNGLIKHKTYGDSPISKIVYQIDKDTMEVIAKFTSVREASEATKSNKNHIANVALGKRKTHNNYKWRYDNV